MLFYIYWFFHPGKVRSSVFARFFVGYPSKMCFVSVFIFPLLIPSECEIELAGVVLRTYVESPSECEEKELLGTRGCFALGVFLCLYNCILHGPFLRAT